jgi:hypothetical protein
MRYQLAAAAVLAAMLACLVLVSSSCEALQKGAGASATAHQINSAAYWDGAVWFLQTGGTVVSASSKLVRLPAASDARLRCVADLPEMECWLLAGTDRLWVLSQQHVGFYREAELVCHPLAQPLPKCSRPFLYNGRPAVIASQPPLYSLMVLDETDTWQKADQLRLRLPAESSDCVGEYLQAFQHEGVVHVFAQRPLSPPVYYHRGLPLPGGEQQQWQKVAEAGGQWKVACIDGKPAFFHHGDRKGPVLLGLTLTDGKWEEFLCRAIGLDIGLGICPTGPGRDFIVLRRILPLGVEITGFVNGEPAWGFQGQGESDVVKKLLN